MLPRLGRTVDLVLEEPANRVAVALDVDGPAAKATALGYWYLPVHTITGLGWRGGGTLSLFMLVMPAMSPIYLPAIGENRTT